jgi:hypothetical protein
MKRPKTGWWVAAAILMLLVSLSAPAFPVEGPVQPDAAAPAERDPESAVETILRQQEDLLRGQHFGYDPENRRDPFQSLYDKVNSARGAPRPVGIRGMMISEISLDGIVNQPDATAIAFFTGSDNKGYFLRVGDRVFDGHLLAIDAKQGTVTFRQQVDDPRQIKPYRDVVRQLVSTDEER